MSSGCWNHPSGSSPGRTEDITPSSQICGSSNCFFLSVIDVYLSLVHVVQRSGEKRQPDVLHLAGLQQVVTIAPLLLQFGFDSRHFLLQLRQLSVRHHVKPSSETLPIARKQIELHMRMPGLTCWHRPAFCGFPPSRDSCRWLRISWWGAGSSGPAVGPLSRRWSSCVYAPPAEERVWRSSNKFQGLRRQVSMHLVFTFLRRSISASSFLTVCSHIMTFSWSSFSWFFS